MKHGVFLPFLLLLAACAKDGGANDNAEPTQNGDVSASDDCPVIGSQNWTAWIDAQPPGPARLHIRGETVLPTPGYTASWRVGAADRMMPPGQHMHLSFTAPGGIVAQVLTTEEVGFEGDATYPEYRVIFVQCGDRQLAEITEIPIAQ